MSPAIRLSAVVLFFIVTVEFGGWSLLSMLNAGGELTPFEEQFFRAGHGHAGVLLVLGLAFLLLMDRVRPGPRTQWALAIIYLLGVLAQSGGFFLHVLAGAETGSSAGTWLTATGGLLLAVALVGLGVVTLRAGSRGIGQT